MPGSSFIDSPCEGLGSWQVMCWLLMKQEGSVATHPSLQTFRAGRQRVSSDAETLQRFMWQDAVFVPSAKLVKGCFNKVCNAAAGASRDCQAPDEPDVAGKDPD